MPGEREDLDDALADAGEDVILRRPAGTQPNPVGKDADVVCRALVRSYRLREEDLASAITQGVWLVSISPTEIANARWPGLSSNLVPIPSIPRRSDQILFHGRTHQVTGVGTLYAGGKLVRIELSCLG